MKQTVASKSEHELFIASRFWERHLGEVPARGAGGRWVGCSLWRLDTTLPPPSRLRRAPKHLSCKERGPLFQI